MEHLKQDIRLSTDSSELLNVLVAHWSTTWNRPHSTYAPKQLLQINNTEMHTQLCVCVQF